MLSEMSATELGEWGDYFRMQSFSDVWMDAQFASLKALIVKWCPAAVMLRWLISAFTGRERDTGANGRRTDASWRRYFRRCALWTR
ncbi:phage tail assembly protein T [Escherichia coli]|uniref:phage tail assembly protein T n=1 Tax=Escherichia coli TaxID=562 RepID=UPI003DA16B4D